jgi:hypothetical protein
MRLIVLVASLVACSPKVTPVASVHPNPPHEPGTLCGTKWPLAGACTVIRDPIDTSAQACSDYVQASKRFAMPLTAAQSALLDEVAREMKQLARVHVFVWVAPTRTEGFEMADTRGRDVVALLERRGIAASRLKIFVQEGIHEDGPIEFVPSTCEGGAL